MITSPISASSGFTEVETIFGRMFAYSDDVITRQLLEFGAHTRNDLAMLLSFVDTGDTIFDIGAHIGTFAVPFAMSCGRNGMVVAVEADETSHLLLCRNLSRHGLSHRAVAIHALVGGRSGAFARHVVEGNTGGIYYQPDPHGDQRVACTVDGLRACFRRDSRVNLIKIDVEGAEKAVLRSAMNVIKRDRPMLYIEMSVSQLARFGSTYADIDRVLSRFGYRYFRNGGPRNSSNDLYTIVPLAQLADGGEFYDLLAVCESDPKFERCRRS